MGERGNVTVAAGLGLTPSGSTAPELPSARCRLGGLGRGGLLGSQELCRVLLLSLRDQTFDAHEITPLLGGHVACQLVMEAFGHVQGNIQRHRR